MEWRVEFAIHMEEEHPNICMYCHEIVPGLWKKLERTEHMVTKHQDLCPICKDSTYVSFSHKILHLLKFHKNDERIRAEGIAVYLR